MENIQTNDSEPLKPNKHRRSGKVPFATKAVARVMIETGHSYRETAKELNVALQTVQRAMADHTLDRKLIERVKDNLPNKLYLIAFRVADKLLADPTLVEKMNPYMCSLVMAIMVDKARLMSDQSTENIAVKGTVAEIQATLQTIRDMRSKLSRSEEPASAPNKSADTPLSSQTSGEAPVQAE